MEALRLFKKVRERIRVQRRNPTSTLDQRPHTHKRQGSQVPARCSYLAHTSLLVDRVPDATLQLRLRTDNIYALRRLRRPGPAGYDALKASLFFRVGGIITAIKKWSDFWIKRVD
jgi:hypothetical protein